MTTNCDECSCLTKRKCNLGYVIYPKDIGGAYLPASDNCNLIKIVTEDDGVIYPEKFENK